MVRLNAHYVTLCAAFPSGIGICMKAYTSGSNDGSRRPQRHVYLTALTQKRRVYFGVSQALRSSCFRWVQYLDLDVVCVNAGCLFHRVFYVIERRETNNIGTIERRIGNLLMATICNWRLATSTYLFFLKTFFNLKPFGWHFQNKSPCKRYNMLIFFELKFHNFMP